MAPENTTNGGSDELARLAAEIKDALSRAGRASLDRLAYYRSAGEGLNAAKELEAHGDWKKWLNDNFALSIRQAQKYMRFAEAPREAFLRPSPDVILEREEKLWREASGAPKKGEKKPNRDDADTGDDGSREFIPTLTKEEADEVNSKLPALMNVWGTTTPKETVLYLIRDAYAREALGIDPANLQDVEGEPCLKQSA